MKTLTIDDELVSREKMKKIIGQFGSCIAVDSGPAGVSAFRKALEDGAPFDLLTLDVSMPEMDGTEVLFEINAANHLARKIGFSFFDHDEIDLATLESAKQLHIQEDFLNTVGEEVKEIVRDSASVF